MILTIAENQSLCEWMIERGLGLGECSEVLSNLECGDTFPLALRKVFLERKYKLETIHQRVLINDWGNHIIP